MAKLYLLDDEDEKRDKDGFITNTEGIKKEFKKYISYSNPDDIDMDFNVDEADIDFNSDTFDDFGSLGNITSQVDKDGFITDFDGIRNEFKKYLSTGNTTQNNVDSTPVEQNIEKTSTQSETKENKKQTLTKEQMDDLVKASVDSLETSINFGLNNTKSSNQKEMSEEEKAKLEQELKKSSIPTVTQTPQDKANKTEMRLSTSEEIKNAKPLTATKQSEIKAQVEAEQKNENIKKGGVDAFNEWAETTLNNIKGGAMSAAGGFANVVTTVAALGIRAVADITKYLGFDETGENLDNLYNNIVDTGNTIYGKAHHEEFKNSNVENEFVRASGEISSTISYMLADWAIGTATGMSGTNAQGISVGGNAAQEVLNENPDNIVQAFITGTAKGYVSKKTEEMFDTDILTRGTSKTKIPGTAISDRVTKFIADRFKSNAGRQIAHITRGIIGENIEEFTENNLDYIIDKLVNNKELPSFEQWWKEQTETAKMTTLSTIIMNMLGIGGGDFKDVEANYWVNQAEQIVQQEDLSLNANQNNILEKEGIKTYYNIKFSPDDKGKIQNVSSVFGEEFANQNNNLDVSPVVVLTQNDYFNVIDKDTGILLDDTPFENALEAKLAFNEKVENLSDLRVKSINEEVSKARYNIKSNIVNILNEASTEMKQRENSNNKNVISNENQIQEIAEQDKLYSTDETKQILNNYGIDSNKIKNRQYLGQEINNIIATQTPVNQNTDNLNNEVTNYMPGNNNVSQSENMQAQDSQFHTGNHDYTLQDINKTIGMFDSNIQYTADEIEDVYDYDWDISDVTTYDENGNETGSIALSKQGDNVVVEQWDTDGNVVQSNTIKAVDGKISGQAVQDAIKEMTLNENRPVEGQLDIEGNEIETKGKSDLQKDIKNFSRQVDAVIEGTFSKNDMLTLLSKTPQPLIDIGLTNLPITMTQKHLHTIMESNGTDTNANYHGLGIDIIKQLPEAINNPLDIVESNTRSDSVVLTTYLADNQDRTIIASIKIDGKGQINDVEINTNVMTSAYGKDNYDEFMKKNLENDKILYDIDRGVIKKVDMARFQLPRHTNSGVAGARLQLPRRTNSATKTNGSSITTNIARKNKNVNSISQKNDSSNNTKSMQKNQNNTQNNQTITQESSEDYLPFERIPKKSTKVQNEVDNQGRKLSRQQQVFFKDSKIRDTKGNLKTMYHGTMRADRVGNVFDPNKATSGPMAFFTDNQDIATNYSVDKQDTSLSREYESEKDLFKINNMSLDSYWKLLATDKKNLIREKGYNVGFDEDYNLQFKDNASIDSFGNEYEYLLKNNGNDAINALVDLFINSGYYTPEQMGEFKKVLDYVTGENVTYLDLFKHDSKVYEVYLNITNPFDTSNISQDMIKKLERASETAKIGEQYSADMWDKSNIEPEKWIEKLHDDIKEGTTHAWTVIPDWVTDILKANGYDGILDTGGKHGGIGHQVAIPFDSNQIKNVDNTTPTSNDDIRYMKKSKTSTSKTNQTTTNEEIKKELHKRIQNALISKNSRKNTFLGIATQNVVDKVKQLYGIDISGRNHIISDYDIRHIIKQHGNVEMEKKKGQIAITVKDIEKIPDIINNYDKIIKGSDNKQGNTIRYIKKYNDNISYVVEVIPNLDNNSLYVKTMWKKPIKNKKEAVALTNSNNAPSSTSKTRGNLTSNISIPQKESKVNTDTSYTPYDERKPNDFIDQTLLSLYNNDEIRKESYRAEDINNNVENDAKTNAEGSDRFIEQQIELLEKTGDWDEDIPVTSRSDIRKTIEDYLGLNLKKGHFRERAYGLYKPTRDVIRVKEYKDMDNVLHEVGHALDLGNRINIDKESISSELLEAVKKHGGYEDAPRTQQLDEGFAEVVREYAIVPEQAKSDYPQSVTVLEGLRNQDDDFNNFISTVQEQIYNYIHQTPRNRQLGNQSIGTEKVSLSKDGVKEYLVKHIWDKDYALKVVNEEFAKAQGKKASEIEASKNIYYMTRLLNGADSKAISMLTDGYIDLNGEYLFPGLNQLGEILGNDEERWNDLRAYLVAQRDLEYKAKRLKTGLRTRDSKAVIEQFSSDAEIQEAADLVHATLDGVLQYAVNNRLITQELADNLRKSNAMYVPMQRNLEDNLSSQQARKKGIKSIFNKRTGSELDIKDVLENVLDNSVKMIKQVETNNVLKSIYKSGEEAGLTGAVYDKIEAPMKKIGKQSLEMWKNELERQSIDTSKLDLDKNMEIFAPNTNVNYKELITSFIDDNGKRVYLQFYDSDVFTSLMGADQNTASTLLKITSFLNKPLRFGATTGQIGFAIPNMISDTMQAAVYSEANFIPFVDTAIGVIDVLAARNSTMQKLLKAVAPNYLEGKAELYKLYQQSGATSSKRMSQYRKSIQEQMGEVYGIKGSTLGVERKFRPLKGLMDMLSYIPELSEEATRFKVFEKNYDYYNQKGETETNARILAALQSRDATQDFSRMGTLTSEINKVIPFSAARVGSSYTFAEKIKNNPQRVGAKLGLLITLGMMIKAIGADDDEINELNQRKKDDNFVFRVGDTIITLKKPQGILRSMINLSDYIIDLASGNIDEGKEGERLEEWLKNAIMDNMPADSITGAVPSAVLPWIENAVNKDFYYNTDIVKSYDLELPNSEQYYDYNSQLAIWLGKVLNYPPAKIDNLINGYFAGLGTDFTRLIDSGLSALGVIPEKPDMGAEQDPIGKRFVVNVNSNSQSVDDIYNLKTELKQKENGGTITEKESAQLDKITQAIKQLSSINKEIKAIKADENLSGKEKADKIRILQSEKTDTARVALGKKVINENNSSKIETRKFYPSSSTLKQNGLTLEMTTAMQEEYGNIASQMYMKYKNQGLYAQDKLESKVKDYAKKYMLQKYKSQLKKVS